MQLTPKNELPRNMDLLRQNGLVLFLCKEVLGLYETNVIVSWEEHTHVKAGNRLIYKSNMVNQYIYFDQSVLDEQ